MKEKGADRVAAHNKTTRLKHTDEPGERSGLEGLTGMDYIRGRIIRPLLNEDRHRIEEYCRENNLFRGQTAVISTMRIRETGVRNQLIPLMRSVRGGPC